MFLFAIYLVPIMLIPKPLFLAIKHMRGHKHDHQPKINDEERQKLTE